jgi:hypothetical protein
METQSSRNKPEGAKRTPEKKQWTKPAATVEEIANVTKAAHTINSKADGATCQS